MRLTDQEIVEKSESAGNSDKALMDCFDMAAWARDFYENQICETCNNLLVTGFCNELTQFMPKTFGCTEWEPKK